MMKLSPMGKWTILCLGALIFWPRPTAAQPTKIPFKRQLYPAHSGLHDGQIGPPTKTYLAFREVIQFPDATWLRLYFQEYNLGSRDDSISVVSDTVKEMSSLESGRGLVLLLVTLQ